MKKSAGTIQRAVLVTLSSRAVGTPESQFMRHQWNLRKDFQLQPDLMSFNGAAWISQTNKPTGIS